MQRTRALARSNQVVDDILRARGLLKERVPKTAHCDLATILESSTPAMDLLLEPDCQCDRSEYTRNWGQRIAFSPSRLIWVGDIVASPYRSRTPHVTVLLEPLEQADSPGPGRFVRMTLPVTVLACVSVAQVLSALDVDDHGMAYGGPCPATKFVAHEWIVDFWLHRSEIRIATAQEFPGLTIATLTGYEHFAQSPQCVILDRAVKQLLIIPCWEIFSWYYAQSPSVARLLFQFPRWEATTLDHLLAYYDGHCFRPSARRQAKYDSSDAARVGLLLAAIGRDAAVSYARSGSAQIRAVPPFAGAARLLCVGRPLQFGDYQGLFIQRILASEPQYAQCGYLRWNQQPHTCPSQGPPPSR